MLSTAYWLSFSPEVRSKLIRLFVIPRSSGSQVENVGGLARVVSDGHTVDDLTAVNIDVLQKMLATTSTDYFALLHQVVESIDRLLEVKDSGAVDSNWDFTDTSKNFDQEGIFKAGEELKEGDRVRIKNGIVYQVSRAPGRPRNKDKQEV